MQRFILRVSPGRKKFQTVKLGASFLCITRWKCNLLPLPSCHEFCRRFTASRARANTLLHTYLQLLYPSYERESVRVSACTTTRKYKRRRWNKRRRRRVRPRFIHPRERIRTCTHTRTNAGARTRTQCISRSLWLGAIRKLYSKRLAFNPPGKPDAREARWNVGAHITRALFRCRFRRG